MKIIQFIFILLLSIVVAAGFAIYVMAHRVAEVRPVISAETAYQRVMRTHTLHCGYGFWAPGLMKDPATGQLSGIFHDYLEALGRRTGLTVDWTEQVAWNDVPAALNSGRIDAMCYGADPTLTAASDLLYTKPIYFMPIHAYVRAGDNRFDHVIDRANASNVTIAIKEADPSAELARTRFPAAHVLAVPPLSDDGLLLLNVAAGKADITFTDTRHGAAFMAVNPRRGRLKAVPLDQPLRLYSYTIPVAGNDQPLVDLLNTATDGLLKDGEISAMVYKYASQPGVLLVAIPDHR